MYKDHGGSPGHLDAYFTLTVASSKPLVHEGDLTVILGVSLSDRVEGLSK